MNDDLPPSTHQLETPTGIIELWNETAVRLAIEAALAQRTDSLEQAEPTDQLIASLRSLSSELDADDSPEQIHPGAKVCSQAADMLEAFRLQRERD